MTEIVKCKSIIERNGRKHECGRFIAKFITNKRIHIKCPSCPSYAIIEVYNGELMIVHVDKEGEEQICKKK